MKILELEAITFTMFSNLVPDELYYYRDYLPSLQKSINFFMTFTPLFSYGTTCYSIYKKKTSTGFSIDICATMIMASALRILYYIISPYEITLLRQSIMQICIQILLLHISLKYRPQNYDPDFLMPIPSFTSELAKNLSSVGHQFNNNLLALEFIQYSIYNLLLKFNVLLITFFMQIIKFFDIYYKRPGTFWQWKNESNYWKFLGAWIAIFAGLTYYFQHNENFGSFIGVLGLFIESLLPLPQILLLNRLKSVKNFKLILLFSWYGGDLTKLSYLLFGTSNVSIIFILAGLFQMGLDIYIGFQYIHFKYYYQEDFSPVDTIPTIQTNNPVKFEVDSDEEEDPFQVPYYPSSPDIEMKQLEMV